MERFAWVWDHRVDFETYEEFNEYFADLKKECDKVARFKDAVVSWKVAEWMKRKKEKTIERLKSEDKLRDYAVFYYSKFFPSKGKLKEKLLSKNPDEEMVDRVIVSIDSIIMESYLMENKINWYLSLWKNIRYIKTKMAEKKFDRDMVNEYLSSFEEWSVLNEDRTRKKILQMTKSGKSISFIKRSLIETSYDEELVERIVSELFPEWDSDLEWVKKLISKYRNEGVSDQKIIQRIVMKGFRYDSVKKALSIYED